jgi:hypothetical protein
MGQRDGKQGHPSREVAARSSCVTAANENEFAGGVQRILGYYAKCKSIPSSLREWAVAKLGRSAARREGKEAVKKMEGVFEDSAFETDQMIINAKEYCD